MGDRGVLYPARLPSFTRLPSPAAARDLVSWFWIPEWDIGPGRVSRQHIIAFPGCNLVVEPAMTGLAGPSTRCSHRDLEGTGWSVGALLRPAAGPAFTADPASLRDRYAALDLPGLHARVRAEMTSGAAPDERRQRAAAQFSAWLAERVPPPGEEALLANAMAELIGTQPAVLRVGDAARALGVSVRTVQRLARAYVGVPPAAMIRRRRLQEAAQLLREQPDADIAQIAAQLGYADHAHLTADFRTVLGFTPSAYRGQQPRPPRR